MSQSLNVPMRCGQVERNEHRGCIECSVPHARRKQAKNFVPVFPTQRKTDRQTVSARPPAPYSLPYFPPGILRAMSVLFPLVDGMGWDRLLDQSSVTGRGRACIDLWWKCARFFLLFLWPRAANAPPAPTDMLARRGGWRSLPRPPPLPTPC